MSQQPGSDPAVAGASQETGPPDDDATTLAAGAPGPSGTGLATAAGADPEAPSVSPQTTTEEPA